MKRKPLHILLIEDNPDHAELVMRAMNQAGSGSEISSDLQGTRPKESAAYISHVADGEAALDYLFRRQGYADPELSPKPDLILLDLRLPKVDGLDVLKEVKQSPELHRIPIVVLSSSKADRDVARAYDYKANSYVVKPQDFGMFGQLLRDVGRYWLSWNTASPPWPVLGVNHAV